MPFDPSFLFSSAAVPAAGGATLLVTALVLGIRHGIDWDHIAAITDITSTSAAADVAEVDHEHEHHVVRPHDHGHGGAAEIAAHGPVGTGEGPGAMLARPLLVPTPSPGRRLVREQKQAMILGSLYALGHALVVAVLGFLALQFGALLPDWIDPLMGRVVGLTLVVLGVWVFVSLYQFARYGQEFRLRSRWMLVFDGARYGWRRLQARLHGHEHVRPLEMSSYGGRTAFAVGMIHGVGAETGSQVLIIAAVGGAAGIGLGIPMMLAFIVGLLISNSLIVILSSAGFVTSQLKKRIYVAIGVVAGVFSLAIGLMFLFQAEGMLPSLEGLFGFLG